MRNIEKFAFLALKKYFISIRNEFFVILVLLIKI